MNNVFTDYVAACHSALELTTEGQVIDAVQQALIPLLASDSWLPASHATPKPDGYGQFPLYIDPDDRLSIVSFVWGPLQNTPVHDHCVWGVVGVLRGEETSKDFVQGDTGLVESRRSVCLPGDILAVSPSIGDIHWVGNESADDYAISIHTYGGNIGKVQRHVFDPDTGMARDFVSGYEPVAPILT
ncbi:MAG: cysteine dioxygenase [Alphaproteobacteria bacterium]|jgi:3-mercaptopropionate dioxygenase|nr:cysteine dioxygenase [Alphaproteobacteria bacterium]MBT4019043.1 cysteine dioxygenase [Alphaproteobacteria bacterium]MBT4966503.1 cysteine dioxygenase [Alphaproteobacteria bacterium]MBT5161707.1 cysteine dioxygenase [Alphaproteobacteria bacterium]MBT5919903.1 cysteine dioxygenase [Alphaproteobacteria bacterium]